MTTNIDDSKSQRRGLATMRLLYFFFFGGVGAYFTFINVYYREIGLSGSEIGLVNTLGPLLGIFAAVFWGMLNDRLGSPRKLLLMAAPGSIIAALLLSTGQSFLTILLYASLLAIFNSAIPPLMDNTTLRLLGPQGGQYGRQRVAGSFGFILVAASVGWLFERTGLGALFPVYIGIMVLFTLAATRLPSVHIRLAGPLWGGLAQMVRQPAWLLFTASATLLWISNNGTMNFIGIVVKGMGGSDTLIGLLWMTAALTEIPILLNAEWLLRHVGSTRLLVLAFATFTLRGVLLALMPSPEFAPFITALGGLSYACFWISAVQYANDSAPDHLKSTAQGLLFSVLNIANMGGALSSGWLFDQVGPRGMFWGMAAFSAAGMLIFITGRLAFRRRAL
jgi:PPP family 3-phenylpropionic acid transporter